ncbi:hypothetical protein [Ferdinandcohnia sp. Marseille-Q9671]
MKNETKNEKPGPVKPKKSIQQILFQLQSQGVNAKLCKRSKFVLGS